MPGPSTSTMDRARPRAAGVTSEERLPDVEFNFQSGREQDAFTIGGQLDRRFSDHFTRIRFQFVCEFERVNRLNPRASIRAPSIPPQEIGRLFFCESGLNQDVQRARPTCRVDTGQAPERDRDRPL